MGHCQKSDILSEGLTPSEFYNHFKLREFLNYTIVYNKALGCEYWFHMTMDEFKEKLKEAAKPPVMPRI